MSEEFECHGYRMITGMLNNSGRDVNYKRPLIAACSDERGSGRTDFGDGRGRLWLNNGSSVRLRPERSDIPHTQHHRRVHGGGAPLSAMHESPAGLRDDPSET